MIIKYLHIINTQINVELYDWDLSRCGVYQLKGDNGSGKSSIFHEIVFGNPDIEFATPEFSENYIKDRFKLISYMPQDVPSPLNGKVLDFICKNNKEIKRNDIIPLLSRFGMTPEILDKKIQKLSGGEKVKCQIISVFLKNTPYIILDEPTNYLDDKSVKMLRDLLKNYANDHVILIATHDPRLEISYLGVCDLNSECKIEGIDNTHNLVQLKLPNIVYSRWLTQFKIRLNWINLLVMIMVCFFSGMLIARNNWDFLENYAPPIFPKSSNIVVYDASDSYDELNQQYVMGEKIKIEKNRFQCKANYNEIPSIMQLEGVENIWMIDMDYLNQVMENKVKKCIIAIPEDFLNDFSDQFDYVFSDYISYKGNLPKDYKNEICISKEFADTLFEKDDDIDLIGHYVTLDGKKYKVVGISENSISMVSFNENKNYGVYSYAKDTYRDYIKRNQGYIEDGINEYVIQTNKENTENVLDELMKKYPASNYYSEHFAKVWAKYNNYNFLLRKSFPFNFIMSIILGFVILFMKINEERINSAKLYDYSCYYTDNYLSTSYSYFTCIIFGILILIFISFQNIYTFLTGDAIPLLLVDLLLIFDFFLMITPFIIYSLWRKRNAPFYI